ncbi:hypothetical protein HO173_008653 [Letharia columbiana]|uniref:Uncharacterized protein n=1 Tax=Letharia columbiana TaxID=112416 RepID=A0A8H6L2J2_9LECA|nr:uncharacterized protein HO173_008653 [Letharia columbiana]KAF6233109.1 hypothetical protein HO173_008653 [Letharia columbiana]
MMQLVDGNDLTVQVSTIGNTYGTTTLSYATSDLHSMEYYFALSGTTGVSAIGQKWNTINYATLISNCTGLPFHNPSWSDGNEVWQNWMYTLKHCYPLLQDSPALGLVDPAWARSDQQIAMYDPPRALVPGKALGPAPPAPMPNSGAPAAAAVAAPASQAAKPTPTPTPAPSIPAPVSSPEGDPPSGSSNDPAPAKDSAANDPQANIDPAAATPAPAKDSASGDLNTDSDPANVKPKPANDPASAKDSFNSDSSIVPQNPKSDPADESESQNMDSQPAEPAPALAPSVTTIAGHSIQVPASQSIVGVVLVDGQSITAGHDTTTVSSTQIALHTNGDLALGTSAVHNVLPFDSPAPAQALFVTTVAGHSIQIAPSRPSVVMVDGQPVSAGASPTTVSSTHIALHTNGDLILGTSTIHNILPHAPPVPLSYSTVGSQTITLSSSRYLAAGTTHAPGDPGFAADSTIVSLGSSALHIGSGTIPISPPNPALPAIITTAAGHLLTLLPSGIVVAALPSGAIAVAGVTPTSNAPAITVSGTLMSLGANGFVNGTTTISLPSVETASPRGGLGGG